MNKIEFSLLVLCVSLAVALVLSCSETKPNAEDLEILEQLVSSSSAEEGEKEDPFSHCVFVASKYCLKGVFTECPEGGWVSHDYCPYDDVREIIAVSSSSGAKPSSSSSARPSSSSGAQPPISSSSAVTPPSSSSAGGTSGPICKYINNNNIICDGSISDSTICLGLLGGSFVDSCP